MSASVPQIGFDRLVKLDWVGIALRVRAGGSTPEELAERLAADGLGQEAMAKTRTKLNGICLAPPPHQAAFVDRAVATMMRDAQVPAAVWAWGLAISAYPFFARVAEFVGRLTSLHGDCSTLDVHRRMSEIYGERQVVKRATQAVLQTQAEWGVLERVDSGKRLIRGTPLVVNGGQTVAWLIEGALRYLGKSVPVSTLQSLAVLYPFVLDEPLGYAVSKSPLLEIRSEGAGNQLVGLRSSA